MNNEPITNKTFDNRKTRNYSFTIPEFLVSLMDGEIQKGNYPNRSEMIRKLLRDEFNFLGILNNKSESKYIKFDKIISGFGKEDLENAKDAIESQLEGCY